MQQSWSTQLVKVALQSIAHRCVDFIRLISGGNMAVATISEQLLMDSAMALSGKSISY